jgi:hypothetical protein
MRYYVPVGPGGPFFRVCTVVTGLMGSLVYWRASRRRDAARAIKLATPVGSSWIDHASACNVGRRRAQIE